MIRMRILRLEQGLSQQELAAVLQISQATVSKLENGIIMPDMRLLIRIAAYFGVSTDYLLDLSPCRIHCESLTGKEQKLFSLFRKLSEEQQEDAVLYLRQLASGCYCALYEPKSGKSPG